MPLLQMGRYGFFLRLGISREGRRACPFPILPDMRNRLMDGRRNIPDVREFVAGFGRLHIIVLRMEGTEYLRGKLMRFLNGPTVQEPLSQVDIVLFPALMLLHAVAETLDHPGDFADGLIGLFHQGTVLTGLPLPIDEPSKHRVPNPKQLHRQFPLIQNRFIKAGNLFFMVDDASGDEQQFFLGYSLQSVLDLIGSVLHRNNEVPQIKNELVFEYQERLRLHLAFRPFAVQIADVVGCIGFDARKMRDGVLPNIEQFLLVGLLIQLPYG